MGKGKKGKKGDAPKEPDISSSLASVSIADQPASSRESTVPPEDAAKKTASPPEPAPAPKPVQLEKEEDDDGGLGLGGGGKKRRPRKKKGAADTAKETPAKPMPPPGQPPQGPPGQIPQAIPPQARGWGQAPPAQMHSGQMHPAQMQPGQMQPGQMHPGQMHPDQMQPGQMHPGQMHPGQMHPGQMHPGQMHPGQMHPGQMHPGQMHPGQMHPGQMHPGQMHPGQMHPGKMHPGQMQPGQMPPAQMHPGQKPPGQVPPGYLPQGQPGQIPQGYPTQTQAAISRPGQPPQGQTGPGYATQGPPGPSQGQRGPPQQQARPPQATQQPSPVGGDKRTAMCIYKIPPKYPGKSVPARLIRVLTNYLPMTIKPIKVHRYDVSFKPDKPKKMIPEAFKVAKSKHFPNDIIAFDQMKNCYTVAPLKKVPADDRLIIKVEVLDRNGKSMPFEVSFKQTGVVDLGTIMRYMTSGGTSLMPPTEAIQCIDVVLRQATLDLYIKAGRQFFRPPKNPIDLGDGLDMWTGLFQSAIFTSKAFINVDVAHKGFPRQQPLVTAISKDFRLDPRQRIDQQRGRGVEGFNNFIKGLRVIAKVGGDSTAKGQKREFICNGLVDPPSMIKFTYTAPDGKTQNMTVADYFTKIKGIRLQYPNLNCMWVGPRDKNIYYPIELLEVSFGQAQNKQLNEMQLSTMVREAATPPDIRKQKIEQIIQDMKYSKNPVFKHFGLEIKEEFEAVPAKILQPPRLLVGGGATVEPKKGAWQANTLLKPEPLQSWGFIALEADGSCFDNIKKLFMDVGRGLGMHVSEPNPMAVSLNVQMKDLDNRLLRALELDVKFLIIIVGSRGRDLYQKVKQKAELDVGILTQCIKEFTATRKMNFQTARNILLKVNSKLMGINQALEGRSVPACIREGGVMVVGADVTHPSPDQSSVPSIAAVTASIDPKCFIYNIQLSIQTPKKEMIVEFEDMMVEHLKVYHSRQRALPNKIYVFRDGVSEGQFAEVMNSELSAVHRAYQTMAGPGKKPEVLFLLVQKRHHTRMFNEKFPQYNVEPGTVVDDVIVHASELDFYLVSHQAIKGTARPTRYHAVCNDGKIKSDEVEQLTYYLCHLYSRCMRAVSYPTPTYYAHLACLRARALTFGRRIPSNEELERKPHRLNVKDKITQSSRMFFV